MDPVGAISLVIDVSKELYAYYRVVRDCDTDIKELRTQLLLLHHTATSLTTALNRDGLGAEDKSQVDAASTKCEDAAKDLKLALDRIKIDGVSPTTAFAKMKRLGRKAVFPFKKSTVGDLADDVESCLDALHIAVSVLQLNTSATAVEKLARLDDKLEGNMTAIESGMRDLGLAYVKGTEQVVQHLLQNRKMLEEEGNRKKAMTIVESLEYPQMNDRGWQIHAADDSTLGDLFIGEELKNHPQVMSLLTFLEEGSGLFWIQGKPASGKSMFMKYLLSRSHGRDQLWVSSDPRDTIFPAHFCWIAGNTMQKSQQGLLRSLLHQVLLDDLGLVPIACLHQWRSASSITQWHEKELWDCLYAAVSASDKQLCFFIDGLDELQPEGDHKKLAEHLNRLSLYSNVKMVVSSRPWPVFERNLKHDDEVMTMENNNRLAIAHYIRTRLEESDTGKVFSEVSWDCICGNSCECEHDHDEAHYLAQYITTNASGVFLWTSLVMDAVCKQVEFDRPVSGLRDYVETLPTELGDYFRNMIFERIHKTTMLSETAMSLWIALLDGPTNLCHFALLCTYKDSGVSWVADPEFVKNLPCTTVSSDEITQIARKTMNFLTGCCRDILDFSSPSSHELGYGQSDISNVTFVHRTVFDYLHTPEMQLLLDETIPDHFKDSHFFNSLDVAACKMLIIDPHDVVFPHGGWRQLGECAMRLERWDDPGDNKAGIHHFWKAVKLAQMLDEVSLYQLRAVQELLITTSQELQEPSQHYCTSLSICLAMHGLFTFTDTLMDVAPQLLSSSRQACRALYINLFQLCYHDIAFDVEILRRLLQAGLDPNLACLVRLDLEPVSFWTDFMKQLVDHKYIILPQGHRWRVSEDYRMKHCTDTSGTPKRDKIYVTSHIQNAIRTFIEFGANLEPGDVEMLKSGLPKADGHGFSWPQFLSDYSEPAKRIELNDDRRKRLRRWPEGWLTEED